MSCEPRWVNYHKHDSLSNVYTKDSPVTNLDYWEELKRRYGSTPCIYTTVNHGWAGTYFRTYDDLIKFNKKNGTDIRFVFGMESYWVKDRHVQDNSNCHIVLLARNDNGRKAINKITSIANKDGYYYRPRIDLELINQLPVDDVMITTACFEKGTNVLTNKGYSPIENVAKGDFVLSHNGEWNEVVFPTNRKYNGNMYEMKVEGCFENIKCTEDHLFPTVEKKHGKVTNNIVWKHAKDLIESDRILDAIDRYQKDIEYIDVNDILKALRNDKTFLSKRKNKIIVDKVPVDDLLLTVFGLFVAEGNFGNKDYSINFTFHEKETYLINIVNKFSKKYLNKEAVVQKKKNSKAINVTLHSKEICLLFKNFIKSGAENKNVPTFIKTLPPYKQMYFIKGLFLGDGCFSKKGKVTFVTISKSLAYDVRDILERNEIKVGCRKQKERIDKNGVKHKTSYFVDVYGEDICSYFRVFVNSNQKWEFNFKKRNSSKEPKEINGVKYLLKRIRSKNLYHYEGTVYCLNVKNVHSFKIDGVNVHNCIAYWNKYEDIDNITLDLAHRFPHFFLEVQSHHTDKQRELNQHILDLSTKHGIPIIAGCDSHVITEAQLVDRDDLLESAHIKYEDEEGWFMDYPTCNVLAQRFKQQGVLNDKQIIEAIANTNVIFDFEPIELDRSLKVPVILPLQNKTQDERNKIFEDIVWSEWEKQRWDINEAKHDEYIKEINSAIEEIEACNMADYFILSYHVMQDGQTKYDGILTPTGRGSAVGMYLNKLLKLTKVDKVNSPVLMYPERFLTKERVLESKVPPDVDNNVSDRSPFIQAQRDLLGNLGTYDLIAIGTLKFKAAWKMYARAHNIEPQLANQISYRIGDYELALKHAEDADEVHIEDYIPSEYIDLVNGCKRYLGIYDSRKAHPCGCLAYSGDAESDIGVILCKSDATGTEVLTAVIESGTIDSFGYLKQDYLIVDSIGLTYDIYHEVGIEPFTVNQLLAKIDGDKNVWNIYADGYTQCVNQCEQPRSTQKVMRYKPQNISELTQFIAAIRPGFQSMYHTFESRQHFEYGIKALDDLIQDEYRSSSFIIYQEDLMKVLGFAGFPMSETYTIIKAISKKKDYVIQEAKPKFLDGFAKRLLDTGDAHDEQQAKEIAQQVWHIIEDNSSYGFNCVSGDTVIYGLNQTVEELYKKGLDGAQLGYSMLNGGIWCNRIVGIYKQPEAPVYKITTKSGRSIKATVNHKFPTSRGIQTVRSLSIFDNLWVIDKMEIPVLEEIKSIRRCKPEVVYDVEMSDNVAHNFVTGSGIVTCNSAHAYCMAIDSVTIAYLKAYYPLEFYKCVLQRFTDKGEKDKVSLIKQEMAKRGYVLKDAKFGDDNRQFNIDHEHNCIVQTLTSIKGMPKSTPQALYDLGQAGIKTRSQLYQALIDNPNINIKAIDILFKLDYFSMFAAPNRLIDEFDIYQKYINVKTLNKEKLSDDMLELVRKHAGTETPKQFRQLDNIGIIKDLIQHTGIRQTLIVDKIKYQVEILGYTTLSDPKEPVSNWLVMDIEETKYGTQYVTMYNICYGATRRYRANKKYWVNHPLSVGDYIQVVLQEKDQMKKNEQDEFVKTGQKIVEMKAWKLLDNNG